MKMYVNKSKNGIIINVGVGLKNEMIGVLIKLMVWGILVRVIVSAVRHAKLTNIVKLTNIIKNCSCKKRLFGKLALAYEDELLNLTETSFVDKNVWHEKITALFRLLHYYLHAIFFSLLQTHWLKK